MHPSYCLETHTECWNIWLSIIISWGKDHFKAIESKWTCNDEFMCETWFVLSATVKKPSKKRMSGQRKLIMWFLWVRSENKIIGFVFLAAPLFSSCFYKNISGLSSPTIQTQTFLQSLPLLLGKRVASVMCNSICENTPAVNSVGRVVSYVAQMWVCLDRLSVVM